MAKQKFKIEKTQKYVAYVVAGDAETLMSNQNCAQKFSNSIAFTSEGFEQKNKG